LRRKPYKASQGAGYVLAWLLICDLFADIRGHLAGILAHRPRRAPAVERRLYSAQQTNPRPALTFFFTHNRHSRARAWRDGPSLPGMKLTVFRIANGAAARPDGQLPKRLKLLAWGDNPAIAGLNPKLGAHSQAVFAAKMAALNLDRVALDFEHNTVEGTPEFERTTEPRAVAAFGVPRLIAGDGLYLDDIQWTPFGQSHALCYCDLSPTVRLHPATGEVEYLHSCALTRAGAVDGLSFYSIEATNPQPMATDTRPPQSGDEAMDWRKMLIAITGAPADVTDEDLQAAFEAKLQTLSAAAAASVQEALTALSAQVAALKPDGHEAELTALSTTVATLKDELSGFSGELLALQRQAVCDQAAREGKVLPLSAEQIAASDPRLLAEMVGKLPVIVPLHRRTPEHIQALSAAAASTAFKRVSETCGQDPAHVAEVNKPK
jgi:phage I-like protein